MRYPSGREPIQRINDDLYLVIAQWPMERVIDVQLVKEWLNCDIAFKTGNPPSYIFCRKIEEAQIIE
jgi:hypothetical protein